MVTHVGTRIDELLRLAVSMSASDLHLTVGRPPTVRKDGILVALSDYEVLGPADLTDLLEHLLNEQQMTHFHTYGSVDMSRSLSGEGRFRINAYRQRGSAALAMRLIPMHVPKLAELGLPAIVSEVVRAKQGLILVTGPTGSGKSTTQAAMIQQINEESELHILTLEDPIEFLHKHGKSMINQREVGLDVPGFSEGLRSALREDPDVILVGEMRDLDTTQIAISAAETGHLVMATLHTPSAAQTIDRIIDIFPPHQQSQVKIQLAASLQAVIAQRLLPRKDGKGRVAALEVLVATPAVRNLIREGKTHQIQTVIQTGSRVGMVSMESSLKDLLARGVIDNATYDVYSNESTLMKLLT